MSGHGTPWEAGGVTHDRFVTAGSESEGIFSLGDVNIFPATGPGPVAIAAGADIAAFIVTACNSHADLVRALEEITQRANESGSGEMGLIDTIHALHGIARAALAKLPPAKGEEK